MKVLVTGSAGFIGSSLSMHLLERGDKVVGIDYHNDYYDNNPNQPYCVFVIKPKLDKLVREGIIK